MCILRKINLLLGVLLCLAWQAQSIDKSGAYIKRYSQKTEIMIEKGLPVSKSTFDIVFQFNDDKSINIYRNYIFYYSFFEKLENINVYTVNPTENGKTKTIQIKDIKYSTDSDGGIFHDDQTEVSIDFLGLVPGSEAHIEYSVFCRESHYTDPMFFKFYLPIEVEEFELTAPNDVHLSFLERNITPGLFTFNKDEKRKQTTYSWVARDVPKEDRYSDSPSRAYYSPLIIFKIDEYEHEGKMKSYCKTVDDLYTWYAGNMKNVNKEESVLIKNLSDSLCKNAKTPLEKTKAIFEWVKTNIRYVAFEAGMDGLIPRNAAAICDKRYGDCKDMTSLQYGLMKAAGLDPHYTWIGTTHIPFTYTELPLKNTDNHMINAIFLDGQWLFLDATDATGEFGVPSHHIQGKQALIGINEKEYKLVTVPVLEAKSSALIDSFTCTLNKTDLTVKLHSYYTGYLEGSMKSRFLYMTEKEMEEYAKAVAKDASNNAELIRYKVPEKYDFSKTPLEFEFTIPTYIREAGDEAYCNLFLHKPMQNEMITDTARRAPVGYRFNSKKYLYYDFIVPSGYTLDYVPDNAQFKHNYFSFSITYTKSDRALRCTQEIEINLPELQLPYAYFAEWNKMIGILNKAYKESIVLKKLP